MLFRLAHHIWRHFDRDEKNDLDTRRSMILLRVLTRQCKYDCWSSEFISANSCAFSSFLTLGSDILSGWLKRMTTLEVEEVSPTVENQNAIR